MFRIFIKTAFLSVSILSAELNAAACGAGAELPTAAAPEARTTVRAMPKVEDFIKPKGYLIICPVKHTTPEENMMCFLNEVQSIKAFPFKNVEYYSVGTDKSIFSSKITEFVTDSAIKKDLKGKAILRFLVKQLQSPFETYFQLTEFYVLRRTIAGRLAGISEAVKLVNQKHLESLNSVVRSIRSDAEEYVAYIASEIAKGNSDSFDGFDKWFAAR